VSCVPSIAQDGDAHGDHSTVVHAEEHTRQKAK
jgi:hypothetical protein